MFTRRHHRLTVNLDAIITTDKAVIPCLIDNISEMGLHIVVTTKNTVDLSTGSLANLEFEIPRDEVYEYIEKAIKLNCEVIWSSKGKKGVQSIGLRTIDENPSYLNFVRKLYIRKTSIL